MTSLRDYRFIEYTQSLCEECLSLVPAKIVERQGRIFLLKRCADHGQQWVLREDTAAYYLGRLEYDQPGKQSKVQHRTERGCPYDCGLCADHEQHTCIGLIEVTSACDLSCPVCYADSGKPGFLSLEQIERMLRFLQDCEGGNAEIVQISGGEPTLHPRIIDILKMAKALNFKYVMLNTNGLRLAEDPDLVSALQSLGNGFEVYLQHDGLRAETSIALRGRDLAAIKRKALSNLSAAGIAVTLAVTVVPGVNDQELGRLITLGLGAGGIRGINIQPLGFFGRLPNHLSDHPPLTLTGIHKLIESQMDGMLKASDFVPLPCNVERVSLSFLLRRGSSFIPLTRLVEIKNYVEFLDSTFAYDLDELLKRGQAGRSKSCCNLGQFFDSLKQFIPLDFRQRSDSGRREFVDKSTFRISISSFVDKRSFDMKSMKKECVHIITPDLKRIPFSAYNMLYRDRYAL